MERVNPHNPPNGHWSGDATSVPPRPHPVTSLGDKVGELSWLREAPAVEVADFMGLPSSDTSTR